MVRNWILAYGLTLVFGSVGLASAQLPKGSASVTDVTLITDLNTLTTYKPLELTLQISNTPKNPFLTDVAPTVTFIAPSGHKTSVQAFWSQDFDPQLNAVGKPGYRVRFTPTEAGIWTTDRGLRFEVKKGGTHGFLRVADNPRYLAFDDGTPFFGVGLNLAWATSVETTLADYERWFDALAASGGNVARFWFAPWGFALEWQDTGLGDYSHRLGRAWLLDQVVQMAEDRGIYLILVLTNHGQFSETTNPEWAENPYNAANGGPCDVPECFATNQEAKTYFKQRLAYIAARYSSPNILAWEWWNEVNFTPIGRDALKAWLTEMGAYLETVDPYHHLTTSSYGSGSSGDLWTSPAVDLLQVHLYDTLDPCLTMLSSFGRFADQADKPVVYGEYGFGTGGEDADGPDREGIHLHNALWASALSGYATTAMYWWWDTLVEPLDLWGHYQGVSTFLAGEDLATLTAVKPEKSSGVCAGAMTSPTRALLWVRGGEYTAQAASDAYTEVLRGGTLPGAAWRYEPKAVSGQSVTLSGLTDGRYTLQSYDPQTATWTGKETVQVAAGRLTLTLPPLARDLAFKLAK